MQRYKVSETIKAGLAKVQNRNKILNSRKIFDLSTIREESIEAET